jgi:outer membrane receptor protein involved in Fe transport
MNHKKSERLLFLLLAMLPLGVAAQQHDTLNLKAVTVSARKSDKISRLGGAENGTRIGVDELCRAACCNLGESFLTNASVDVNYNDAATGARQIKLLGLSGQYVQMLAENLPMGTGAAMPYVLGYVPGTWMKSISVSKGASSVKNGFQSVTGQINVEYLKPDDTPGLVVNLYGDHHGKAEGNVVGNVHLNEHLSTEVLAHYEKDFNHHADDNGDGWIDVPAIRQLNLMNRWKYTRGRYIFHGGAGLIDETRHGGSSRLAAVEQPVHVGSRRYEAYMKHAVILDREHNTNIALMGNVSHSELDGHFATGGLMGYNGNAFGRDDLLRNTHEALNATLMLEHEFNETHSISTGIGILAERLRDSIAAVLIDNIAETVPGAYAQYTYKPSHHLTVMAGLRADHVSGYDRTILTPRLHVKWMPSDYLTLRGSTGKGYRIPYALAENHYLLASWRPLQVDSQLPLEEAWNSGLAAALTIPMGESRFLNINAEYYYTDFLAQTIVDYDSDPSKTLVTALDGRSFSHTAQVDATYAPLDELDITVACRLNDVRCTYNGQLREKPLTSRYKALLTVGWKPMMELWQVDLTFCMNGPGRLPAQMGMAESEFPAYPTLNLQLMRRFRHWSVYIGGENLTNYRQPAPVLATSTPDTPLYDPSLVYGPIRGIMAYAGVRLNFWKQ